MPEQGHPVEGQRAGVSTSNQSHAWLSEELAHGAKRPKMVPNWQASLVKATYLLSAKALDPSLPKGLP